MKIQLTNPWFLLVLPVVLGYIFHRRSKNNVFNIMRIVVLTLLVLALSGFNISRDTNETNTIFLIDKSSSMLGAESKIQGFVNDSLKYKDEHDSVGVISFGNDAQIEYAFNKEIENIRLEALVNSRYTNIEEALNMAITMASDERKNRIVLISDGEENVGDVINMAGDINNKNIEFKVVNFIGVQEHEVQINGVKIPSQVYKNQKFDIEVELWSNVSTKGNLKIKSGDKEIGTKEVAITKGINRFVFSDQLENTGIEDYKVEIQALEDNNTLNNQYLAFTKVLGSPRVLLIDNEAGDGTELVKMIESMDIDVDHKRDREIYMDLSDLLKYKAVIMTNISLENLDAQFDDKLQTYVKDFGGGLVVTGGETSYALGGYYKTELEEILPLDMEIKRDGIVPSVSIMLVIDKSGSMSSDGNGVDKLAVAREAAIRAVETMKPTDNIGIITFDDMVQLVTKPLGYTERDTIKNKIASITGGGGTTILPALKLANEELASVKSDIKHIILLTDGQAERSGYDAVIKDMNTNGITISTIAVGEGADINLLDRIAREGKGRFYHVVDYNSMPTIFTKETLMVSKMYLNNREFYPELVDYNTIVEPVLSGIPLMKGYIGTSVKPEASLILKSDEQDPILAHWRYGLGQVVGFTSDVNGKWSENYLTDPGGVEFIKNMVRSVIPVEGENKYNIQKTRVGDEIVIQISSEGDLDQENTIGLLVYDKDGNERQLPLILSKPGVYEGRMKDVDDGIHVLKIQESDAEKSIYDEIEAISVNYSNEYNYVNRSSINEKIILKTSGVMIKMPEEVFSHIEIEIKSMKDVSDILVILAFVFFIIDIAFRKFNVKFRIRIFRKSEKAGTESSDDRNVDVASKTPIVESHLLVKGSEDSKEATKKVPPEQTSDQQPKRNLNTNRLLNAKKRRQ